MGKLTSKPDILLICALLAIVTAAVYGQVASFQFVNFDDCLYVRDNPLVQAGVMSPVAVRLAFSPYEANWIPLVWISYMIEHDIGTYILDSESAGIYHVTNALLHIANTVLLFVLLAAMTGRRWPSAFVAALFALHPLHVESVAWVAERKDVLSTLLGLLTMLAYVRYTRAQTLRNYGVVVALFALGLMAKPMLVTLPILLLLLDYWPLDRIRTVGGSADWPGVRRMLIEKIPLFAFALAGCVVTVWAQGRGGAMGSLDVYPFGVRLANALAAYTAYIGKMFRPIGLCFLYPHPGRTLPEWHVIGSAVLLAALTALACVAAPRRPYVIVGWLWYVITLVPVIGLVQVGRQAMADRYTYVPLIGLFIIVAWGIPDILSRAAADRKNARPAVAAALSVCAVGLIGVLAVLSYRQVGCWRDSISLCEHAIQVGYDNPLAHCNLARALEEEGNTAAAAREYRIALKLRPDYVDAYFNLGTLLGREGKVDEAVRYLSKGLQICPANAEALNNLGNALRMQGKLREAARQYRKALRLDPANDNFKTNLENTLNELAP